MFFGVLFSESPPPLYRVFGGINETEKLYAKLISEFLAVGNSLADQALSLIRSLYAVEQKAKTMTAEERLALRENQSRLIVDELEAWLTKSLNQAPPKTAIGKALHYLANQWKTDGVPDRRSHSGG